MPNVQTLRKVRRLFLGTTLSLLACGAPEPPLEQLELRDALLADPGVIAGLSPEAQQRLAGRFWTALVTPDVEATAAAAVGAPEQRLRHFDTQRKQRGQDAFLAGFWTQHAATQTLTPLTTLGRSAPLAPLPPFLGTNKNPLTKVQETRALWGRAGAVIEDLRVRSGAVYLERVTSWPTAVVAIEDHVYVNATWLVAMAALESPEAPAATPTTRAGAAAGTGHTDALTATGSAEQTDHATTTTLSQTRDPGTLDPDPSPGTAASAAGSSSSCNFCSSASCSSCSSSSSSNSSSCDNDVCVSAEDKQCCRACAIAPERRVPDLAPLWMTLWLGTPLLLLGGVDLGNRAARRRAKV